MRKWSACWAVLLLLLSVSLSAEGESVQTDPCDSADGKSYATYHNLRYSETALPFVYQAQGASDPTSLKMISQGQPAQVVYQVDNPESVEILLYTKSGTFAVYDSTFGWYRLGISRGSVNVSQTRPCVINEEQEIFLKGEAQKLYLDNYAGMLRFYTEGEVPGSGLPHLGLTIEASRDGTNYQPVEARLTSVETYSRGSVLACYGERYAGQLPSGTVKIRLTLRDVSSIPYHDLPRPSPGVTIELAQVNLIGGSFAQPVPPPDSSSQPESSSSLPPPDISGSDSGQDEESSGEDEEESKDEKDNENPKDDATADGNSSNRSGGGGVVTGSGGTRVVISAQSGSSSQNDGEESPQAAEEVVVTFPQTETVTSSLAGVERGILLWAAAASLVLFGVVYWMFRR